MAFGRGFVWPDAIGTPTDPTIAFQAATTNIDIGDHERQLICEVAVTGGDCRAIQILLRARMDGTNWRTIGRKTILGTAIGTYGAVFSIPAYCEAIFSVRRYGGTANTLVTIMAYARSDEGTFAIDGQPIELAPHQVAGVECWGDGAGGHAHPAAGPGAHAPEPPAAGDQQWIPVGEADTLVIDYLVAALAATTIEFEIRESTNDAGTTNEQMAVNSVAAGVINQTVAQEQVPGALGRHQTREISVRPGTAILVLAQRTGGGANTELTALARLYKLGR